MDERDPLDDYEESLGVMRGLLVAVALGALVYALVLGPLVW